MGISHHETRITSFELRKSGPYGNQEIADRENVEKLLRSSWTKYFFVFIAYFLVGKLGLYLATINSVISPVWPVTGVAIWLIYIWGFRFLPSIYLGSAIANYTNVASLSTSGIIGIGSTIEAAIGALILVQYYSKSSKSNHPYSKPLSLLAASLLAPLPSAAFGVLSLYLTNGLPSEQILQSLLTWWTGDALGALILLPIAYIREIDTQHKWKLNNYLMSLPFLVGAIVIIHLIYYKSFGVYLLFLPLILSTFAAQVVGLRFFYRINLVFYSFAIYSAAKGFGPFSEADNNTNLLYIQLFFFSCSLINLAITEFYKSKILKEVLPTLIFSLVLSTAVFSIFVRSAREKDNEHFQDLVRSANESMMKHAEIYESALRASAGYLANDPQINHQKWKDFISYLNIQDSYPGLNGIGFILPTHKMPIEKWERYISEKLGNPIKVKPVPGHESTIMENRFVIVAIEPFETNKPARGLDVSSESNRLSAALKAQHERAPTVTREIQLVQDNVKRAGFLYYYPAYKNNGDFIGWTYAPVVWAKFLKGAIGSFENELTYSIAYTEPNGSETFIFHNNKDSIPESHQSITHFRFADKTLNIHWSRSKGFQLTSDSTVAWVTLICSLISVLLATVVANLKFTTRKANQIAAEKTRDLENSHATLIQTSKMTALGEMAGGVAHEINNPLAIIRARMDQVSRYTEMGNPDKAKLTKSIESIVTMIDRITKIINGLKTFSQSGTSELRENLTVKDVIENTLMFCHEKLMTDGIDIQIASYPFRSVYGGQSQLSHALFNIITNSIDAVKGTPQPWIKIDFEVSGERLLIHVLDSGSGIPKEIADKIMQPFFTTKPVGKGTGLGLSIAQGIIESHQGRLYYNPHFQNTCFTVELPLLAAEEVRQAA